MMTNTLCHHGILGQKWGVRRYRNDDGSLTEAGKRRLEKKDSKWASKKYDKIYNKAYKKSARQLAKHDRALHRQMLTGKAFVNSHNQKMAELMTQNASQYRSPSGKVVKFVAKRGELGVHLALATDNYDMSKLKNGIWGDGRVAYKSKKVGMV